MKLTSPVFTCILFLFQNSIQNILHLTYTHKHILLFYPSISFKETDQTSGATQYTGSKCGEDLIWLVLTSNPPKQKCECMKCGWSHEEQQETIIRIPFPEPQPAVLKESTYTYNASNYSYNACKDCSNNPANGGNGICHCTLNLQTTY